MNITEKQLLILLSIAQGAMMFADGTFIYGGEDIRKVYNEIINQQQDIIRNQ